MACYCGLDPGIKGALALLDDNGEVIQTWKMPLDKTRKFCPIETWKLLREIDNIAADQFDSVACCIEGLLSLPSDTAKIKTLFESYEILPRTCIAEKIKVELSKTDGRVGSVTMGKNFGILIGQIAALGWKYVITPPRSWQSIVHQGITGPTAKIRSYNFVKTIFPEIDVSKRGGGFDDGVTDALCIAYYCRKKLSV